MNDGVRLIVSTDETGLHISPEQLARAGITPGSRAVIGIRPYTEEDRSPTASARFRAAKSFWRISASAPRTPRSSGADLRRH